MNDNIGSIVFEVDPENESLLNILLKHEPPLELIQRIVEANPKAVSNQSRFLSQTIIPSVGVISQSRMSPISLFVAVKFEASADVVRLLCESIFNLLLVVLLILSFLFFYVLGFPEGAVRMDDRNTLPIHRALLIKRRYGLSEVVKVLVQCAPDSVKIRSGYVKDDTGSIISIMDQEICHGGNID